MTDQQEEVLTEYVELVRFMATALLPDDVAVEVKGSAAADQLQIDLLVPEAHRGRVIGKGGRIARAMRTILTNAALPNHQPVALDIVD